jgi:hypothetical protein
MHGRIKALPVCLVQPSETAELVERLEDAQMALGGMAANRYAAPFRDSVTAWLGKLGAVGEQARARALPSGLLFKSLTLHTKKSRSARLPLPAVMLFMCRVKYIWRARRVTVMWHASHQLGRVLCSGHVCWCQISCGRFLQQASTPARSC